MDHCRYYYYDDVAWMHSEPRMASMKKVKYDSPNIRKGRFLWMEPDEQRLFISSLKLRIANGYYFSEKIMNKVADELSPVLSDVSGEG